MLATTNPLSCAFSLLNFSEPTVRLFRLALCRRDIYDTPNAYCCAMYAFSPSVPYSVIFFDFAAKSSSSCRMECDRLSHQSALTSSRIWNSPGTRTKLRGWQCWKLLKRTRRLMGEYSDSISFPRHFERLPKLILLLFIDFCSDCKVPFGYSEDPRLANWVSKQRKEYKKLQEGKPSNMTSGKCKRVVSGLLQYSVQVEHAAVQQHLTPIRVCAPTISSTVVL